MEVLLAKFGIRVSQLWSEVQSLQTRLSASESQRAELERRLAEASGREIELLRDARSFGSIKEQEQVSARASAQPIIDAANLDAARIRADAALEVETARGQVEDLLRLRDTLSSTMRAVVREFESLVGRIDRSEPADRQSQPSPTLLSTPGIAATAEAPKTSSIRPAEPSSLGLSSEALATSFSDGHVELNAGPFSDFASLSAFERALGTLPNIEDVYIRRFEGERATIDVTLQQPGSLLNEMTEGLPYRLDVEHAGEDRIAVTVSATG